MDAPTPILMDMTNMPGCRFRNRCRSSNGSFQTMLPALNTSKGRAGEEASSVRTVV
jgi:hypothetical protein